MEILFYRRSSPAQKRKGTCSIQCRITIDGERAELGSTHIVVAQDAFDDATKRVLHSDHNAHQHNLRLQYQFETKILAIYNDFLIKGKPITAEKIKLAFESKDDEGKDSLELMSGYNLFLKDFEKQTRELSAEDKKKKKKQKSYSSLGPWRNSRNKLLTYLITKKKQCISIGDIDNVFFENYEQYLWDLDYKQSYIFKQLKNLLQVTRWLKRKKHIKVNPLADIEVGREDEPDPVFLDLDQFEFWRNFKFKSRSAQIAADIFTICCRTAFHYQDIKQFLKAPELYLRKGLDGNMWIYKPRQKTEVVAKIPIDAFYKTIKPVVEKYGGWANIPIPSNKSLNEWLKICVAEINLYLPDTIAPIYEQLSVKHARKTFCNWWINDLGRTVETLLPIMGRTSDYGLGAYVRTDERAIIAALKVPKRARIRKAG